MAGLLQLNTSEQNIPLLPSLSMAVFVFASSPKHSRAKKAPPLPSSVCGALKWGIKPFVSNYIWQPLREFRTKARDFFAPD